MSCKCGRIIQVNEGCIEVKCHYCCHNSVAEQLQKENENSTPKKTKRKKLKKYYCAKYKIKKTKTRNKCDNCKLKNGCELWSLRSKK